MRVYVELADKDTAEKICTAVSLSGGVVVARQIDADLYVGEKVHPFLETVLISSTVPADLTGIIDILLPSQSLEYYLMKFKLICHYSVYSLGLEDFLNEEIYKSRRYSFPLSILMTRVMNSTEELLPRIYSIFKSQARESDKLFIHDKSIIMVLPYTNLDGAKIFARRLLRRSKTVNYAGKTPEIVISIAQSSGDDDAIELLEKLEYSVSKAIQTGQRISIV